MVEPTFWKMSIPNVDMHFEVSDDVDDELKDLRESSGANWSELGYRKLGKRATNKKKTAAVEKENAKKRREEARENNKRRKRKEETDWF